MKLTHTKTLRVFIVITLAAVLQGCINTPHKELQNYSQYTVFKLNKLVSIDADSTRVYFQNGNSGNGFNHFEQHCRLEINTIEPSKQLLSPDIFKITKVQLGEEMIATWQIPLKLAGLSTQNLIAMGDGNYEPPETMDLVHFYLKSERQPDVYRLTCAGSLSNGSMHDYPRSIRPDAKKINEILGEIGRLEKR